MLPRSGCKFCAAIETRVAVTAPSLPPIRQCAVAVPHCLGRMNPYGGEGPPKGGRYSPRDPPLDRRSAQVASRVVRRRHPSGNGYFYSYATYGDPNGPSLSPDLARSRELSPYSAEERGTWDPPMDEIDGCIMLQSEAPVLCLCSPWGFGELKAQAEFQMWLQEVANVYLPEEFYQCRHVNCKRKIRVWRHELSLIHI